MKNKAYNDLIKNFHDQSYDYVFLVSNPISVCISKMFIEKFNLNQNAIHVFSFRNTDASLIKSDFTKIIPKKGDSILGKILWDSPTGNRILKKIPNKKFILFTEWANRETEKIISHSNCLSHIYIEMGQHSYLNIPEFYPDRLSFIQKFIKNWKNKLSEIDELAHYYFRNDALLFVGMNDNVFPGISNNKKIILDNISSLKSFYKPKLLGDKIIGLTCAWRRIKRNDWENMLLKLFKKLPTGSLVKAHPSFYVNHEIYTDFKNTFEKLSNGNFRLCNNEVILEIEILFEKKIFFGPKTAISRYAKFMESKFNLIELY